MNAIVMGAPPARSRQEVVELIGLIGESDKALEQIDRERDQAIGEAKNLADIKAEPIKAARAEAQAKVEAYFRIHPESAVSIPGADQFVSSPMETQLAAAILASDRPLTARQRMVLEHLKDGCVLRRQYKRRSYSLISPEPPHVAKAMLSSSQVFDLQVRFLDGFDPQTGDRLLAASALTDRAVEFRLKPGVVLS